MVNRTAFEVIFGIRSKRELNSVVRSTKSNLSASKNIIIHLGRAHSTTTSKTKPTPAPRQF